MNKNKMYRNFKDRYTEKQMEDIMNGKEIADVWEEREKKVKKTGKESKKEYNANVLKFNVKKRMKSYKFTKELDEAIIEKSYEMDSPIKKMFSDVGLSTNTYFAIKRRGVISPRSLYKIKKLVPDFDFTTLEIK